jgi:hypothetical protein
MKSSSLADQQQAMSVEKGKRGRRKTVGWQEWERSQVGYI